MLVYRVCTYDECKEILSNKSFDNAGYEYFSDPKQNTFNYELGTKYLHFYKELSDAYTFSSNNRCVLCLYNIDNEVLNNYAGTGYYGYKNKEEYAIPIREMKFEYLVYAYLIEDINDLDDIKGSILYKKTNDDCEVKHKEGL